MLLLWIYRVAALNLFLAFSLSPFISPLLCFEWLLSHNSWNALFMYITISFHLALPFIHAHPFISQLPNLVCSYWASKWLMCTIYAFIHTRTYKCATHVHMIISHNIGILLSYNVYILYKLHAILCIFKIEIKIFHLISSGFTTALSFLRMCVF